MCIGRPGCAGVAGAAQGRRSMPCHRSGACLLSRRLTEVHSQTVAARTLAHQTCRTTLQDLIVSNSEDKSLRVWDMSKRIGVQVRRLATDGSRLCAEAVVGARLAQQQRIRVAAGRNIQWAAGVGHEQPLERRCWGAPQQRQLGCKGGCTCPVTCSALPPTSLGCRPSGGSMTASGS